jgi:hypothetical protein
VPRRAGQDLRLYLPAGLHLQLAKAGDPPARCNVALIKIARELHLLRAQVKVLELQMQAETDVAPIEA